MTEDDPVEVAVGQLYVEFYRLRQAGKIKEEYVAMGTLMDMLAVDRGHMRRMYPKELEGA